MLGSGSLSPAGREKEPLYDWARIIIVHTDVTLTLYLCEQSIISYFLIRYSYNPAVVG